MRSVFTVFLLFLSLVSLAVAQDGRRIPQFRDYAAESPLVWLPGPVDFSDPEVRKYRTRLTDASKQWANFAGHHVLTTWGCGTQCLTGAILDLPNGKVTFLPTVCCWGDVDEKFKPFEFRKESRLVVMSGQLNEQGENAAHFFEFKGRQLIPLLSLAKGPVANPAPPPAPADDVVNRPDYSTTPLEHVTLLRTTVAISSVWPMSYRDVIQSVQLTSRFDNVRQTEIALSFLARGASPIQIQTIAGVTIALYNPVLDVGLVLNFRSDLPRSPLRGALFPGEMLRLGRIEGIGPEWTKNGAQISNIQRVAQELRRTASATVSNDPIASYSAGLAANTSYQTVARDRILAGAMIANNAGIACGAQIDGTANTIERIRAAVAPMQLQIAVPAGSDGTTYAVGGVRDGDRSFKVYALRANPAILVAVWFKDQADSCRVSDALSVNVAGN